MDIEIQNKKIELIQWLSTLNDVALIKKIMELRDSQKPEWWLKISEEEKTSIQKGIKDAEAGKVTGHADVRKLYDKWL